MKLMIALAAAWLLTMIATGVGGWLYGHARGSAKATEACQQANIDALTGVIDQMSEYAKSANTASLALSETVAARKKTDQLLTRELEHALSATADERRHCVFDDRIMQLIQAAADRADEAAARGLGDTVRSGTETQQ